jgi:hypothetical protein
MVASLSEMCSRVTERSSKMVREVRMKSLLVMALAAGATWGQGNGSLRARELFYTPPPSAAVAKPRPAAAARTPKPAARKTTPAQVQEQASAQSVAQPPTQAVAQESAPAGPLGMRYSVLKRDAAGRYQEVDPDSTFHSGDRIRLEIQANSTGYLYVVAQGSSGNWQVLFPSREVAGGSNQVHRGETRQIPSGGQGQFVFDEQAGTEKLFLVLSRQPEANLDKLIYSMGDHSEPAKAAEPPRTLIAQATVSDDVISRVRGQLAARDLIFEKVENEKVAETTNNNGQARMETAAYVVNPSGAADARLVADVRLKHE